MVSSSPGRASDSEHHKRSKAGRKKAIPNVAGMAFVHFDEKIMLDKLPKVWYNRPALYARAGRFFDKITNFSNFFTDLFVYSTT